MKKVFWLLDINTKVNDGKIDIWLWGIDKSGNRILLIDHNFSDYFYAVLHGEADGAQIAQQITLRLPLVAKAEVISRRFFGKPVTAVKISCKDATQISKAARQIRKLDSVSDCYEDDIRTAMRYLIDNNVVPCSWHEAEIEEAANPPTVRAAQVYHINSPPKLKENSAVAPPLRVLSFSMICYSREGTPKPDRNPVIVISTVASNGEEKQFIANQDKDDTAIIQDFIAYIQASDPDVIVSYGANTTDWNYLLQRSHHHGLLLGFDRAAFEPHTSVYGHMSSTGLVNIDLADFVDMFPEVKVKTLSNIANNLRIESTQQGIIEEIMFADYWDDTRKKTELLKFSLDNAHRVYGVASLMLDFAIQLSSLTSLPLDHVMTAATGFRVEWYLIKQAQNTDEIVPRRIEQAYMSYAGGLVLSPKPGLHENIAILDFKSMYPNIMITYNLSPDTYIQPGDPEPPEGVYIAPEVGYLFRKSPPGFYKEALTYLIDVRGTIRQEMKPLTPRTVEYNMLDARQKAVKILTNAAYGYAGWIGARWYLKPVAEAASAWGRHIILTASQMAKQADIPVIYGDTDSLFIKYDKAKAEQLQANIKRDLKLDVEIGEIYERIFFTEAKKRYAGLRKDGSLDIVGLEVIRGDWAEVAKLVQEHVLEIILKEQSPEKAIEYVRGLVADLRHRRVPFEDLVIWKTLTKAPEAYAVRAPHVAAAKVLIEKGWQLSAGDKVGYVVLSGKGPLHSRVMPYVFAKKDQIDVDYYVTNQVLPAAERILGFFNVTQNDLETKTKEEKLKSLTDFF